MTPRTSIALPYPPSVNRNTRAVAGRVILSRPYRLWKQEAATAIMLQRAKRHMGPVTISIDLCAPDKRLRDIDNPLKSVLDALKASAVIEDDNNRIVRSVSARWVESGEPCVVTVEAVNASA